MAQSTGAPEIWRSHRHRPMYGLLRDAVSMGPPLQRPWALPIAVRVPIGPVKELPIEVIRLAERILEAAEHGQDQDALLDPTMQLDVHRSKVITGLDLGRFGEGADLVVNLDRSRPPVVGVGTIASLDAKGSTIIRQCERTDAMPEPIVFVFRQDPPKVDTADEEESGRSAESFGDTSDGPRDSGSARRKNFARNAVSGHPRGDASRSSTRSEDPCSSWRATRPASSPSRAPR